MFIEHINKSPWEMNASFPFETKVMSNLHETSVAIKIKCNETEIKMEKKKTNDWMCQSQKIPSNDCEKAPN